MHEEKRCTHGARTPVSFPATPTRVHGGAHFCMKRQPHGNLTSLLVVHLMEGGSSTTGEQTNCDLVRHVKKEANNVGPTLEARLYTLEYF